MLPTQSAGAVQPVTMDSRKFLSTLNDSAQAKVAFFEERIQQMGAQVNKSWQLAALQANELVIEDADTHDYFIAAHSRQNGKIDITNIRPIQITEGKKEELFQESTIKLINAIEVNDAKGMAAAFDQLKSHRFSSRVVPESGIVRCRDGVTRRINIANGSSLDEGSKDKLVACLVENLKDRVIIEDGFVVGGSFGDEEVALPVTKWAARKLIARRMQEAAKNAYMSEGFQTRICSLAKLITDNKIEEAVNQISKFVDDMEEFTLLTRNQTQTLVENALATRAIFNQPLCNDTTTLFYRTNLKVNKDKIVTEWKGIARKAEHHILAENVNVLENARNFEATYDKFLKLIFETISNREVAAEALATTLNVLRDKTPKIKESHELSSKLNGLITRLKQRDCDDAAIYEAEDLIATIQEELGASETLGNFDQMPGDTLGMDQSDPGMGGGAQAGAPVININSPLIQIGGSSSGTPGGAADAGAAGTEAPPEEGDPELAALLGGGAGAGGAGAGAAAPPGGAAGAAGAPPGGQPIMQSLERDDAIIENSDPYAIRDDEEVVFEGLRFTDYGAPVITDEGDLDKIIRIMQRLAVEHKLAGRALQENIEGMAKASIKAIELRIPEGKMPKAVEQIATKFFEEWQKPWLKDKDKKEDSEDEEEGDEEGVAEDQYKIPLRKNRGFARSNLGREVGKPSRAGGAKSESIDPRTAITEGIKWGESQDDAIKGEMAGVTFILDHGGDNPSLKPAVLSEDGGVEIPIPADLCEDALAAAQLIDGDGQRFVEWLAGSIEQLRPISEEEDRALEEAVAKITAGPDGTLSVEVTPDVEVGQVDDGGGEPGAEEGMAPVDTTDTSMAPAPEMGGEEQTPNFDAPDDGMSGGSMADGEMGAEPAPPTGATQPPQPQPAKPAMKPAAKPSAGTEPHFEDRDITSPPSAKYAQPVKDNKRKMPEPKLPSKTNDKLDGIGPDLKVDDGSGTNPPTAKKGSDE